MKIVLLALIGVPLVYGAVLHREEGSDDTHSIEKREEPFDMVDYLERYGYLNTDYNTKEDGGPIYHSDVELEYALRKYQEFTGLPVTGMMDSKTYEQMHKPRCGFKDILPEGVNQPQSYTHLGGKWPKDEITWKTVAWTNQMGQSVQKRAMENAFKYWQEVTPLTFKYTDGTPDIEVKFARGEHGDGQYNAFDGKGKTLAHAFGPGSHRINGDTHFDDDEEWTYHSDRGTELQTVAAHEFGHALGLGHSGVRGALMAPYYQGYDPNFKLHSDDIRAIQILYGSNPNRPTTTTPPPTTTPTTTTPTTTTTRPPTTTKEPTSPNPGYCSTKLDAIVTASDGFTYAFRYRQVYKLGSRGLEAGYPKRIRAVYPRAPGKIRGAFYMPESRKTYFFKGSRLWRYTDFKLDYGFPKTIYTANFPESIRAIINIEDSYGKSRVFMFGSNKFWEWNPNTLQMVPGWSYNIVDHWLGIPRGVEAAVKWYDGHMYFFKGASYRKFNNYYRSVEPGYPKPWAPVWMRNVCAGASLRQQEAGSNTEFDWDMGRQRDVPNIPIFLQ
ncbi:matrix metalloproteinase-19-like [Haliotis asinina]|uniref:matrix metalloproteinase-19-like n=1 Tax=Haliotis asinina TaxID=109174 RepID=UPI0035323E48